MHLVPKFLRDKRMLVPFVAAVVLATTAHTPAKTYESNAVDNADYIPFHIGYMRAYLERVYTNKTTMLERIYGNAKPHESEAASGTESEDAQHREIKNAKITGYYCKYNGGYYGDGGGYCDRFANGQVVSQKLSGEVAACGYDFRLGTRVYVPDVGELECVDRGHLESDQIDVFFYRSSELSDSGVLGIRQTTIEVKT